MDPSSPTNRTGASTENAIELDDSVQTFDCSWQALERYCVRIDQMQVLARPGWDIQFISGFSLPLFWQIQLRNVMAILIQSRGQQMPPCNRCARMGSGPFQSCVILPGILGDTCASCHWARAYSGCSHYDENTMVAWQADLQQAYIRELRENLAELEEELAHRGSRGQGAGRGQRGRVRRSRGGATA